MLRYITSFPSHVSRQFLFCIVSSIQPSARILTRSLLVSMVTNELAEPRRNNEGGCQTFRSSPVQALEIIILARIDDPMKLDVELEGTSWTVCAFQGRSMTSRRFQMSRCPHSFKLSVFTRPEVLTVDGDPFVVRIWGVVIY